MLLGLYAAPLAAQDAAPAACPLSAVPARAGTLDLVGWEKFPSADLGSLFRYRAVGTFGADVYLYPAKATIDQEIGAYKQSLEMYRTRGEYESFEIVSETDANVTTTPLTGKHVVVTLKRGTQAQRSHYFLFAPGAQYVKVRLTYPEGRYTDDAIKGFVTALMTELTRKPSSP
jgi:hypothetical protein